MAFNEIKISQAAAWFLARSNGSLTILKLMKLLYLAERQALATLARPLSGDRMVSMPHGPVLSKTYELSNGSAESVEGGWDAWMSDRADRTISLRPGRVVSKDSLDMLSDAEVGVLDCVQRQFGHMTASQLRDYTHTECDEWRDPCGSSLPIPVEEVLRAVGKRPEERGAITRQIEEDRELDRIFAAL